MQYATLFILAMALSFGASGTDSTAHSSIYLSYMPQLYFNKVNVRNGYQEPNLLQAKNTVGSYLTLGYQRITRHGLMLGVGIGISERKHDIAIVKRLQDIDPAAASYTVMEDHIRVSTPSIDPEIMIGYRKQVSAHLFLTAKAGLQQKHYKKQIREYDAVVAFYLDSNNNMAAAQVYGYNMWMGRFDIPMRSIIAKLFDHVSIGKFSVGAQYEYPMGIIKFINVDMEASLRLESWLSAGQRLELSSKTHFSGDFTEAVYIDRLFSIGLRVGVGLWK